MVIFFVVTTCGLFFPRISVFHSESDKKLFNACGLFDEQFSIFSTSTDFDSDHEADWSEMLHFESVLETPLDADELSPVA